MADLATYLAETPGLTWITGTVKSFDEGALTMEYGGGLVQNCGYLDQYSPAEGDVVHALSWSKQGVLVLGSDNKQPMRPELPSTLSPVTVNATTWATYSAATSSWASGVVQQAPGKYGTWFYSASAFTALAGALLAKVEMSLTGVGSVPPELVAVVNPTGDGSIQLRGVARHAVPAAPAGTNRWVTLPLDWGYALITGEIHGVGVGGGLYTGAYSGAGNSIRLTPL